jgi:hypothetical protein
VSLRGIEGVGREGRRQLTHFCCGRAPRPPHPHTGEVKLPENFTATNKARLDEFLHAVYTLVRSRPLPPRLRARPESHPSPSLPRLQEPTTASLQELYEAVTTLCMHDLAASLYELFVERCQQHVGRLVAGLRGQSQVRVNAAAGGGRGGTEAGRR